MPCAELISIGNQDLISFAVLINAGTIAYNAIQIVIESLWSGISKAVMGISGLNVFGQLFLKQLSLAYILRLCNDASAQRKLEHMSMHNMTELWRPFLT